MFDFLHDSAFQSSLATVVIGLATLLGLTIGAGIISVLHSNAVQGHLEYLKWVAALAVHAAEQAPGISDKKASALNVVNQYLKTAGITSFTAEQIDAAIEAAVLEELNNFPTSTIVGEGVSG